MKDKQTAVNWILDKLAPYIYYPYAHSSGYDVEELIEQAKAMEKEQIEKAFQHSMVAIVLGKIVSPKEYYEETYGK